ncbi:hypothetical protein K1T35_17190 [Pseudonocardia sp. DSM 110487]|uniref:hypothetical protein n=1 Tax=Pseudonocardia sp. DSM 110487 TaxID=2865833 RepID=UPI001C695C5C|nr:hypothetical protein [Pseudonocardia sp. DSM 110487]QYN38783.1 hypothetical protein K1T35_17190 [Pseudonocardia sp. DSM 110487]
MGRGRGFGIQFTGHTDTVVWGSWGRVGNRPILATGSNDQTVRLWEVIADRAVPRLPSYRSDATAEDDALDRGAEAAALAELITAAVGAPAAGGGVVRGLGRSPSRSFLHPRRRQ